MLWCGDPSWKVGLVKASPMDMDVGIAARML